MKKILMLTLVLLVCVYVGNIVYAYSDYGEDSTFFSAANTYNWIDDSNGQGHYDLESPNNNLVDTGDPKITFLTHGLNGSASHWSNLLNYEDYGISTEPTKADQTSFSYTKDSLITRLNQISESQIYWAIKTTSGMNLVDISAYNNDMFNQNLNTIKYDRNNTHFNNKQITSINKHIIIVFQAQYPDETNDSVYSEFNYIASEVINQVKNTMRI